MRGYQRRGGVSWNGEKFISREIFDFLILIGGVIASRSQASAEILAPERSEEAVELPPVTN